MSLKSKSHILKNTALFLHDFVPDFSLSVIDGRFFAFIYIDSANQHVNILTVRIFRKISIKFHPFVFVVYILDPDFAGKRLPSGLNHPLKEC